MTIKDIAKQCSVSVSTVSRVLNDRPDVSEDVRRKVLSAIKNSNYIPNNSARDLVRTKSDAVGLVVRGVSNPFYTDIIRAIERTITDAGFTMVMQQIGTCDDEVKCGAVMEREKRLQGIVFLGGRFDYTPADLAMLNVPFVCCSYSNRYGTLIEGEYSSVSIADGDTAQQAVELAAFRGRAMADAAKGIECGMTAVMNLDRDALAKCCEEASALGCVQICNYNCPGQLVIGGEKAAVAKAAGARRCIPLKVSGPFHTRLMHPAGDALAERFEAEHFGEMETPVLFNCLGHEKAESDTIPALLEKQVQSSVYMEDTLRRLGELGVTDILEVGPGKALSGFVKKTLGTDVRCTAVETAEELEAFLTSWKEAQA